MCHFRNNQHPSRRFVFDHRLLYLGIQGVLTAIDCKLGNTFQNVLSVYYYYFINLHTFNISIIADFFYMDCYMNNFMS